MSIEDRLYAEVSRCRSVEPLGANDFRLYLGRDEWNELRAGTYFRQTIPCKWKPKREEVGQMFGFDMFIVSAKSHLLATAQKAPKEGE